MQVRKSLLLGMLALGLSTGAVTARADMHDCGPHGPASAAERGQWMEHMREHMEKRAAALHDRLKLNASQEAAWKSYIAQMKPAEHPARPDRAEMEKMSAPERMEKMLGHMQEAEKHMADRVAATKEFFGVLTPEQQKIFNDEFAKGHHRHHRG